MPPNKIEASSANAKGAWFDSPSPTLAVLSYKGRSGRCTMRSRTQCENTAADTTTAAALFLLQIQ